MRLDLSPGDRAALRRGVDPWEVRGFYNLLQQSPDTPDWAVALAAPILADIKQTTDRRIGQLARGVLSEKRIRRLLNSERDDLVVQIRRLVKMADGKANPDDIVNTLRYWGENARRRIARDYFGGEEE
jgi:CRISPR type I-E-associated protein CasB/Cse2